MKSATGAGAARRSATYARPSSRFPVAGSAAGAEKTAASRIGVTVAEYRRHRGAGEKWCRGCRAWHPRESFGRDRHRGDGRKATCRDFDGRRHRETYRPIPLEKRRRPGPPPSEPREGDTKQARHRVNALVEAGRLPRPNESPLYGLRPYLATGREAARVRPPPGLRRRPSPRRRGRLYDLPRDSGAQPWLRNTEPRFSGRTGAATEARRGTR